MATPIHVLVVEDSEPDALLMMRVLRNAGYEPACQRVDTPGAMRSALENDRWDLVIADYSMPHFSGEDALQILQETERDIPFILVSGTIPGEIAIRMMVAGAQDYVVKQDMARLAPAVTRELRMARIREEREQAMEALSRSESNFRAIFDYTPAAIFSYDKEGIMLQANAACEELYGIPRDEMIGRSIFKTVTRSRDTQEIQKRLSYVFSGGSMENIEWMNTHPDGTTKWVLTNITPVFGADGKVIMGLSLNVDITERKRAEQTERELEQHKLEFYRRTIEAATDGKLIISDPSEIEQIAGPPIASWEITDPADLAAVRDGVANVVKALGMDESTVDKLILVVGEAATNAIKHAGGGTVSLHRVDDDIICVVSDEGHGIAALNLPDVALTKGYSTVGTLGMGYKIMMSFANKIYLATGPEGTTVAIRMSLKPVKMPGFNLDRAISEM
jgi:PAS domain S-box-containing protein